MAIQYIGIATGVDEDTTNPSLDAVVTPHASTRALDLMVAIVAVDHTGNNGDFTPPGGWTLRLSQSYTISGTRRGLIRCYEKVAAAADLGASTTWTFSGHSGGASSDTMFASLVTLRQALYSQSTSQGFTSLTSTFDTNSATLAALSNNDIALGFASTTSSGDTAAFTPPSGFTERYDANGHSSPTSGVGRMTVASLQSSGGSLGTKSFTYSTTGTGMAGVLVYTSGPGRGYQMIL